MIRLFDSNTKENINNILKLDEILITILMPIYNGIEFIEDSVNSVLNQTHTKWELIIGINGHPQNSYVYNKAKEYEKKNDKIKVYDLYYLPKGKSYALNEMVRLSSNNSNYVALLDVDDIWYTHKLSMQIEYINSHDVVGSRCVYFGSKLNDIIPNIPVLNITNYDFKKSNPIINSSSILKKELAYWDTNYTALEDYELWLRLKSQGKKFYNRTEILVKHRIHSDSAFNSKDQSIILKSLLEKY